MRSSFKYPCGMQFRPEPNWPDEHHALFGGDALGFEAGDANLYRYVTNQPTTLMDPSGLAPIPPSEWPRWLRDLVDQENATGGRGIIRTITSVNRDFSHARGSGGAGVPAHYDVEYEDENGRPRSQRFRRDPAEGGRRAFTDEEHAAMNQDRETDRARRRARRNTNRLNGLNVVGVYLSVTAALEHAGVGPYAYREEHRANYYFTAEDGSVFFLQYYEWPASMWSDSRIIFIAGPREGQSEVVSNTRRDEIMAEGVRLYGQYNEPGWFRDASFTPGTLRTRMPLTENGIEVGYIDATGPHRYHRPRHDGLPAA